MEENKIVLNEDQTNALEKLTEFIKFDQEHSMALLEGCAGSGKTTLIQFLIKRALEETMQPTIAMVGPTHKSVKVMKEMCPEDLKGKISFSTLHSLLGLKHNITKDGKEIYVRDPKVMSKFPFFKIIIIDEASMIADQLFDEIVSQNYNGKIIFIGDSNQINPVNHPHSIPMLESGRKDFKILHYKLTKIVRQAADNPIIKFSQQVLNNEFKYEAGYSEMMDEEAGIVMLNTKQAGLISEILKHYFCSEKFDKDSNYCRLIAWRNATVDQFNKNIRIHKYGINAPKIVVGEKLIVDRPIKNLDDGSEILFHTNEDLIVKQVNVITKKLYDATYTIYEVLVDGDDTSGLIHILHENSTKIYNINLKKFADDAKSESGSYERVKKWRKYFEFMENFAQVNYGYAQTVHTSQGSTYENCFVVYSDIIANSNEKEQDRILYTAITRPRKMLYIM